MDKKQETFAAGDVLRVNRGLYSHFGIYVGNGKVIHFSGGSKSELNPKKARIIKTGLDFFVRGDPCSVSNDISCLRHSPEEIIQYAERMVGTDFGGYSLVRNNCEHFARWCENGVRKSDQVDCIKRKVLVPVALMTVIFLRRKADAA